MEVFGLATINEGREIKKIDSALSLIYEDFSNRKAGNEKRAVTYRIEIHQDGKGYFQVAGKLDVKLAREVPRETFRNTIKLDGIDGQLKFEFQDVGDGDGPGLMAVKN